MADVANQVSGDRQRGWPPEFVEAFAESCRLNVAVLAEACGVPGASLQGISEQLERLRERAARAEELLRDALTVAQAGEADIRGIDWKAIETFLDRRSFEVRIDAINRMFPEVR